MKRKKSTEGERTPAPARKQERSAKASPSKGEDGKAAPAKPAGSALVPVAGKPAKIKERRPALLVTPGSAPSPFKLSPSAPDPAAQRSAKAAAKEARIKRSGVESRVLGHVSARGKRDQGRRDAGSK